MKTDNAHTRRKLSSECRQTTIHPCREFRGLRRITLCKREDLLLRADQGILGLGHGIEIFGLESSPFITHRDDILLGAILCRINHLGCRRQTPSFIHIKGNHYKRIQHPFPDLRICPNIFPPSDGQFTQAQPVKSIRMGLCSFFARARASS